MTPMCVAATRGHVDLLKMLIDGGGDVNIAYVVSLHVTGYLVMPWWVEPKRAYCSCRHVCVCYSFNCFSAQLLKTRH